MSPTRYTRAIDTVTGGLLLALGAAGLYASLNFPDRAGMWPAWVTGLLLVLAAALLLSGLRRPGKAPEPEPTIDEPPAPAHAGRTVVNIVLIIGFIVCVPLLGLFSAAGLYLAVHMLYLGVRPLALVLAVTAGAVLIMYGFFGVLLGVRMPGGLLI